MAVMCPSRLPKTTVFAPIVGEPDRRPKPFACHNLSPVVSLNAATAPPALAATTTPPLTTGVPFTGPTSSACHTAFSFVAEAAVRVAPAGWPSRARSPRYMGQFAFTCALGEGVELPPGVQAAQARAATAAHATRRRIFLAVLLAGVNRLRWCRWKRVARAEPPVEPGQRTRSPPIGAAEKAHDRRHDEDADDRSVDGDRDGEADPDRLDDHDVGHAEGQEHRHHDCSGAGDETAALLESQRNPGLVVAGTPVLLLNPADQKHLVVHRHAEDDAEEDDRNARIDRLRCEAQQIT